MRPPACLLILTAAALLAAPAADAKSRKPRMADGYSHSAEEVLAQARNASGGAGWNMLRGIHTSGHQGSIRFETWVDPLRYGLRTETHEAAGVRIEGFNGQGDWQILPDGKTLAIDDHAAVDRLRTEAFLAAGGIFYTSRFEAHGEVIGVRSSGGKSFDVLNVQPWAGAPRELWFDRASHLLARIVDRTGPQAVTTELSDYRRVGPVKIAFHTVIRGPGLGDVQDRQLDAVVFAPADRSLFSLPRTDPPPAP